MPFSYQDISVDRIVQAVQLFCRSIDDRLMFVYEGRYLRKGDPIPVDFDSTLCRFFLKRNCSESDALVSFPVKFSISLCSMETVGDVCHTISDGIYQLITETVEFSTASGYSVKSS